MARYGIWNSMKKEWQFGIDEPTPKKAEQKLFKKIGYDSYKWRFEVREIKEEKTMKLLLDNSNAWAIVPEGDNVKLTIESAKAVPSGKPSTIEVTFKHENGGTIKSNYNITQEIGLKIFSILIRHTLGTMDTFDTADVSKLVGKAVYCEVVHKKVKSTKDETKELTFANIAKILSSAPSTTIEEDVSDIPFAEEDDM